jgi:hypothetical protein
MSSEPLFEFFATHRRLRECLEIATRVVEAERTDLLKGTDFGAASRQQAREWIGQARKDADELAIVALWAWFERYLVEYVKVRAEALRTSKPAAFAEELKDTVTEQIEYWRIDDILDLFKSVIDANQIGVAKRLKKYRDWVAHRNPNRVPSARTDPTSAYSLLAAIIDAVERVQ